jgi:DNA-binding NarL/FixJ family response regulator
MIKVLMVDDHAIIRKGVKQLLDLTADIRVEGEAANGKEVIKQVQRDRFDILLLDINLPDVNGVELIEKIRHIDNRIPILVLSMHEEAQIAMMALQAGAAGYLTKGSDPEQLPKAIRKVADGGHYIETKLALRVVFDEPAAAGGGVDDALQADRQTLSERELDILKLLAKGNSLKEIAAILQIERGTVSTYKTRIMRKLGFRNNADLLRYAVLHGW